MTLIQRIVMLTLGFVLSMSTVSAQDRLDSMQAREPLKRAEAAYFDESDWRKAATHYQEAADLGSADAKAGLARLYWLGRGVEADQAKAISLARDVTAGLERRAASGDAYAQYYLSVLLSNGIGMQARKEKAIELEKRSAESGLAWSQANLAYSLLNSDPESAMRWIRLAAGQQYPQAYYLLGLWTFKGRGTTQSTEQGLRWLLEAASRNHVWAAAEVGRIYLVGDRVPVDLGRAEKFLQRTTKQDDVDSIGYLGQVRYLQKRYMDALDLFRTASGRGNTYATFRLGQMFSSGEGTAADRNTGCRLFEQAHKESYKGAATYNLAVCRLNGWGGAKSETAAVSLAQQCAMETDGDPAVVGDCAIIVGHHLENHVPDSAFKWFEKTAMSPSVKAAHAKYHLGKFYLSGTGVTADRVKGMALLKEAVAAGDDEAISYLQKLAK